MKNKPMIMIADHNATTRATFCDRFEKDGYHVFQAANKNDLFSQFEKHQGIAVVITNYRFGEEGETGIDLIKAFQTTAIPPKVIMIAEQAEKNYAVDAFRMGAADFFDQPVKMEELAQSVERAYHQYLSEKKNIEAFSNLQARLTRVEGKSEDQYWFVSKSKSMESVNDWLRVLQKESMRSGGNHEIEDPACLIQGMSGTGKEGIARMIHAGSKRAKGPWISVHCATFNSESLETELFGFEDHKAGLFELANGGTLYLDEVASLSSDLQDKIFSVLENKNYFRIHQTESRNADFRLICSSSFNLRESVDQGLMSEDFYHRISKVVIDLPSLCDREDDIVPMSDLFFERAFTRHGKKYEGMSEEIKSLFQQYSWPGNVRELLNVVERTALLWNKTGMITPGDVILKNSSGHHTPTPPKKKYEYNDGYHPRVSMNISDYSAFSQTYTVMKKKWSEVFEREYLVNVLNRTNGNVTAAAKESGIDRSNFLRLLRRHGIQSGQFRKIRDLKEAA
jgi:DNA-binding NtrC family response regulator